jgi:hypothetical protein
MLNLLKFEEIMKHSFLIWISTSLMILSSFSAAQIREYRIHDRGMLHNTVFNTGEIGRGWMTGEAGNKTSVPLFEWPSRSKTTFGSIEYSGQHNLLGAGVYMAANLNGKPGKDNRLYSFCGGVGASQPEVVFGRWSFPLYMEEIENFPLLPDGDLNPDYNPDEAEEIITTAWASSIGITVTRTSRAWSYPDYDDMIIYEYTFEYTGDTDGNPATVERDAVLTDVMILFNYGFAPSMYGYQRHYQIWKYEAGIYRGDQRNSWDADYWLSFNLDVQTDLNPDLAGKPEPDRALFRRYSETGEKGGGLCSPQAPGYCMLYYDTNHLAVVDPDNSDLNESEAVLVLRTSQGVFYELDENKHIKQPWSNKVSTGNTNSIKMMNESINPDKRWSGVYSQTSTTWPQVPRNDPRWYGRAAYNYRQSNDAGQKHLVFGPYTLRPGDKLHFALAEVVGYGAEIGKRVEGGQVNTQWAPTPGWNKRIVIQSEVMTENYLEQYGYPDYVNSEIKNVTQVAHKAFEAYLGHEPTIPVWPEDNPSSGSYKIPVPVPAPIIDISNTLDGNIRISWKRAVESFTHPRLMGNLIKFNIYTSNAGMGPWRLLGSKVLGDVTEDDLYEFIDDDQNFKIGESRFYAVTSLDNNGNESGKTNITQIEKNVGSVEKLEKIYIVPNPLVSKSGFQGSGSVDDKIGFYGLPEQCTIRIFSYSGQLIETIEHIAPLYSTAWFQTTRNGQEIASGIYFYLVTTPNGDTAKGKFVVIK